MVGLHSISSRREWNKNVDPPLSHRAFLPLNCNISFFLPLDSNWIFGDLLGLQSANHGTRNTVGAPACWLIQKISGPLCLHDCMSQFFKINLYLHTHTHTHTHTLLVLIPWRTLTNTETINHVFLSAQNWYSAKQRDASFKGLLNDLTFFFSFFFLFLAMPCYLQDPGSPTRDWTWTLIGESVDSQPLHSQGITWIGILKQCFYCLLSVRLRFDYLFLEKESWALYWNDKKWIPSFLETATEKLVN